MPSMLPLPLLPPLPLPLLPLLLPLPLPLPPLLPLPLPPLLLPLPLLPPLRGRLWGAGLRCGAALAALGMAREGQFLS